MHYVFHRINAHPRRWEDLASEICAQLPASSGDVRLFGIWRSQIGRPRDELSAISVWTAEPRLDGFLEGLTNLRSVDHWPMQQTSRPLDSAPPTRQGNYAFRWFDTPEHHWDEFMSLCEAAWPSFESAFDSQIIGLWRAPLARDGLVRSLLLTRRPDLAMWERSKIPGDADEQRTRDLLSRRYDLCEWTVVYTTTLLSASDREDSVRWA
jgi:hypothetical protein